jgi:hypothetical protein
MRRAFAFILTALLIPSFAHAQSFDGKYEGKLLLTKGGAECGPTSDEFVLEVKGAAVRIVRGNTPFEGKIESDGQLFASGTQSGFPVEWRAQILATKTGLGTMIRTGSGIFCQFLISLKRT